MRNRRTVLVATAIALTVMVLRHPTADIRLVTHDASDPAPHRLAAAVDLGLIGVSFLYTWSRRLR